MKILKVAQALRQAAEGEFTFVRPRSMEFNFNQLTLCIEDWFLETRILQRAITISSQTDVELNELINTFNILNQVIMICEGCYHDVTGIEIDECKKTAKELNLLPYMQGESEIKSNETKLIRIHSLPLNRFINLLVKWEEEREKINLPFTMFSLMATIKGIYPDIRTATFVQCLEGFSVYIYNDKNKILHNRLEELIDDFGEDCFPAEQREDYITKFLACRNMISHAEPKKTVNEFLEKERALLPRKLHIFIRHILLQQLGLPYKLYSNKLKDQIKL